MNPIAIATDIEAEDCTIGILLNNPFSVPTVVGIVKAGDFYQPAAARLFPVSVEMAAVQATMTPAERLAQGWDHDGRIAHAARSASVSRLLIAELIRGAPTMFAVVPFAERVANAARRRELMAVCGETYNDLGKGESLNEVVPNLARALHQVFPEFVKAVVPPANATRRAA